MNNWFDHSYLNYLLNINRDIMFWGLNVRFVDFICQEYFISHIIMTKNDCQGTTVIMCEEITSYLKIYVLVCTMLLKYAINFIWSIILCTMSLKFVSFTHHFTLSEICKFKEYMIFSMKSNCHHLLKFSEKKLSCISFLDFMYTVFFQSKIHNSICWFRWGHFFI